MLEANLQKSKANTLRLFRRFPDRQLRLALPTEPLRFAHFTLDVLGSASTMRRMQDHCSAPQKGRKRSSTRSSWGTLDSWIEKTRSESTPMPESMPGYVTLYGSDFVRSPLVEKPTTVTNLVLTTG